MGSKSGSSNGGGGAAVQQVPPGHKKIVQSLKEVVNNGNCTDSEIYAVLRDCDMDPNVAVQKLLSQDIFHEVKSKRERRKEMKDTHDSKIWASSSHIAAKVNAEHYVGDVQSQAELGKAAYKRDGGSAAPVLPPSSLTYQVKAPTDRPSSHSDSFEGKSTSKNLRPDDSSAKSSQSAWLGGSSGNVSVAAIVRMRGPQTNGIQTSVGKISHSLPDADCDALPSNPLKTSPSPPERDQNAEYPLPPNGSEGTLETVTLLSENGFDNERHLTEQRMGDPSTFNCSSAPGLDGFSSRSYTNSSGYELSADSSLNVDTVLEDAAPKYLRMDFVKSVPVSITRGSRSHLASISSSPEILPTAEGLQQLSLDEKPAEVISENKNSVVFPDCMQAFAANCSHLSFGTYKSGVHPPISGPAVPDSERSNSFAAKDSSPSVNLGSPRDLPRPDHLATTRNIPQLADSTTNCSFPLQLQPELIRGNLPGAAQQHEYFSQLPLPSCSSKKFQDHSTSSSDMMHPNALNVPPLRQELRVNSNTLPIELFQDHDDLLSAFGSTQQMPPSRYGSIPPSTGGSSILIPEGFPPRGEPALSQHATKQPFSQPALSLEELAKMTGYAALSPNNYERSSSSSLRHAYEETASFNDLARIKNLKQFKGGDASIINFPRSDAADVSGYGRQSNFRGNFPRDLSSNLSASALHSSFNGGNNLSSLRQNDISSPSDYGSDASTLSAIPNNQYYGLHGYSQLLSRYNNNKQDHQQQLSQDYGTLGYGSLYPSQGRTSQEHWNSAGSFQDPSSNKQQQIWGQNY